MRGESSAPDAPRVRVHAKSRPRPRMNPTARVAYPTGIRPRGDAGCGIYRVAGETGETGETGRTAGTGAELKADPNASALAKRSAGVRASAFAPAASTGVGSVSRSSRTGFAVSMKRRAIIACGVETAKGTSPVSIA